MTRRRTRRWHLVIAVFGFLLPTVVSQAAEPATAGTPERVRSDLLENAFRVNPRLFSGGSPESDAAFAELQRLGVRVLISVDGTKPDVTAARRHGMRYIHLPIGYDAVPTHRWAELIAASKLATHGAVYLHCHHGRHRGPAAVAVLCQGTEGWTREASVAWMKQAGTAAEYDGLFRSVNAFRMPPANELPAPGSLPETATTTSLVDGMVEIDHHFDHLKAAQTAAWTNLNAHPDVSPARAATLLHEALKELRRLPDSARRPEWYRQQLDAGISAAESLSALLRTAPVDALRAHRAMQDLAATCKTCHRSHRN
jgi:cytochrome c556